MPAPMELNFIGHAFAPGVLPDFNLLAVIATKTMRLASVHDNWVAEKHAEQRVVRSWIRGCLKRITFPCDLFCTSSAIISMGRAGHLPVRLALACLLFILCLNICGCGTTKSFTATEQLLLSDAVDTTVAKLDFSPLTGQQVYLDVTYIKTLKSPLLIDSDYVISSLRQKMVGAGVLLVENREEADIVAEARLGALGMNGHDVVYGVPASSALSSASAVIGGTPLLPSIPEISFARREGREGAAKIAVFAYHRETRQPYWQSGIARSNSSAKDLWLFGIGPFQKGSIREGTRFAGSRVLGDLYEEKDKIRSSPEYNEYAKPRRFSNLDEGQLASADNATADGVATDSATADNATAAILTSSAETPIAGESSQVGGATTP